jgi:glycosyltransferase involved in cell wall biosynthesis
MKVSVIIATYNSEKYLGRAIRSLIDQSFSKNDFEILVVDDGSTDHTQRVLESFGDWIKVITLSEHKGLPAACNIGLSRALGRYTVRVDADDYVHEDLLRIEYLYMTLNHEYDAVACDYYLVDENERRIARCNAETDPIGCGIMFKKDNLVAIGLYDEDFKILSDDDLRIRYLQNYNIRRIELPLYRYRRHDSNITGDKKAVNQYRKMLNKKHGGKSQ